MSIPIAKWKDSVGNTQRASVILMQEVDSLILSGDHETVKSFVSQIVPSEWRPATMLGFLRGIWLLSSDFKPEFEKLLANTKLHLATLPDWKEERIEKATRGLN